MTIHEEENKALELMETTPDTCTRHDSYPCHIHEVSTVLTRTTSWIEALLLTLLFFFFRHTFCINDVTNLGGLFEGISTFE